jgi:ATP-dependent RNA helicase DeaD
MTTEFNDLNLHPQLLQAVLELGYTEPMPIQSAVIPALLAGQDVIGQAQTGTGKTAAFALPMLQNLSEDHSFVQGLVLAPTRELALQVAQAISDFGRWANVRVLAVYGGAPYRPQISALYRGVDIVVGTPGRLMDLMEKNILDIGQVRTVVLDEADEMLSMGFIEDIEAILSQTPAIRQTALFSATMPEEIRRLAERYMHDPQTIAIRGEQVTLATIEQRVYLVNQGEKVAALTRLFEVEDITSALIFARTRLATAELATELSARGFPAEVLNGDLNQESRERTLSSFRQGKITVLVATDVAARGLDIENISHVFNFDLPDDPEIYVHRIGRTGRAGKTGIAISLFSPREKRNLREIEFLTRQKLNRASLPTEDEIRSHREQGLLRQVDIWLRRGRFKREREIVENLVQEGYDPIEIAAASLKIARADEKQRPIAPVSEVVETRPVRAARERTSGRDRERTQYRTDVSHEPGMVRLSLNMGRKHGVRPNDIVGAIAAHARIPGSSIGKIHIQDEHALVDVPEGLVNQVLVSQKPMHIRKQRVELQLA